MLLHIFDGSIDARWLEVSKRQGCIELLLGAFKVDLLVVNACSLSCFLAALCSMWMAFLVLSTWESVVNSSYSFWGEALTPWCQLRGGRSQIRSLPTCRHHHQRCLCALPRVALCTLRMQQVSDGLAVNHLLVPLAAVGMHWPLPPWHRTPCELQELAQQQSEPPGKLKGSRFSLPSRHFEGEVALDMAANLTKFAIVEGRSLTESTNCCNRPIVVWPDSPTCQWQCFTHSPKCQPWRMSRMTHIFHAF